MRNGLLRRILRRLNLRFPTLFLLFAALTVIDLIVPDVIPFADEIALALVTAILASLRRRPGPPGPEIPSGGRTV